MKRPSLSTRRTDGVGVGKAARTDHAIAGGTLPPRVFRPRARLLASAVLLGSLLALLGCGRDPSPAPSGIVMFGDSLLYEARPTIRSVMRPGSVEVDAVPGAAPCALIPGARARIARRHPRLVVLETAGSNGGACMAGLGVIGSRRFTDRYVRDVGTLIRIARDAGAEVLVVDPPPVGGLTVRTSPGLRSLFRRLRREFGHRRGVTFSAGPRNAVSDLGVFAARLPCLPEERGRSECVNGTIPVRDAYFGVHLCPKPYSRDAFEAGCPVYSSGAIRFGRAIATAAVAADRGHDAATP